MEQIPFYLELQSTKLRSASGYYSANSLNGAYHTHGAPHEPNAHAEHTLSASTFDQHYSVYPNTT